MVGVEKLCFSREGNISFLEGGDTVFGPKYRPLEDGAGVYIMENTHTPPPPGGNIIRCHLGGKI
jgi:hypothetical protein